MKSKGRQITGYVVAGIVLLTFKFAVSPLMNSEAGFIVGWVLATVVAIFAYQFVSGK